VKICVYSDSLILPFPEGEVIEMKESWVERWRCWWFARIHHFCGSLDYKYV